MLLDLAWVSQLSEKMEPQIVAMGGGGFATEPENVLLEQYVLSLSRNRIRPKVCFLPTASGDSQNYIERSPPIRICSRRRRRSPFRWQPARTDRELPGQRSSLRGAAQRLGTYRNRVIAKISRPVKPIRDDFYLALTSDRVCVLLNS
jgi:hypothetical protein